MPRIHIAALLIACAILAGCRERSPAASRADGPPRLLAVNELSDAEKLYGHSAAPSRAVTYQPDVVMLPDGATAIRGVSADSVVWTIDPDSEAAEKIQPGKVLLATSRAVGRVLAVEKGRDGLRVVLGPVEITEVIRDGQFNLNQPVNFTEGLSFARPEVFDPPIAQNPLLTRLDHDGVFVRPVALAGANPVVHRFSVTPLIDSTGVGVRIKSTGADGVMFLGEAVLYLKAPELHFTLDIRDGKVTTVEVELAGVAGLLVSFEAAMPRPTDANIDEVRPAFSDLVIPVSGLGGVPFAVNVRQKFLLKTMFTSTGALKARGYYTLKGGVRAGYRDGKFSVGGPTGFGAQETLLPSLEGVAMGPTGMVMTHQVSVIVGLGAFGFVTGPYAYLNSSVAATKGSSIGAVICRQESVSMGLGAGVGYQMPEQVTNAINAVLSVLGIRERIQSSGGIQTKPTLIVQKGWYHPGREFCKI